MRAVVLATAAATTGLSELARGAQDARALGRAAEVREAAGTLWEAQIAAGVDSAVLGKAGTAGAAEEKSPLHGVKKIKWNRSRADSTFSGNWMFASKQRSGGSRGREAGFALSLQAEAVGVLLLNMAAWRKDEGEKQQAKTQS